MDKISIKCIRQRAGMTQNEFAEYFGIPRRTVESWEAPGAGARKCQKYLSDLMIYKLEKEGIVKRAED